MIRYEYDLDVTPGGVPVCVNLSQYDQDFELRFRLYSREGYLDIKSGTTVSIRGTKKDNRGYSAVAVIDGTLVTVAGNVQMTAVAGRQDFELTLLSSEGKELNTANFFLCVERAAMDKDTVKSESVIKEFEGVSEMAERIMDDVKNARESLERVEKNVSTSVSTAESKADAAARSAATAGTKAAEASSSADTALAKAEAASESAAEADGYATEAESYAHGGTGTRTNEDVDNAKYYYEQAKRISQGLDGTLLPMGTVTFSQLESQTKVPGYMYNISDAFTTDSSFKEGAGFRYPSGTNVYRTADDFWDCLAGTSVVLVNGQTGAVTITPESIGAIDDETQIQFQESNTPVNIESGENIPAIFGKIKKMIGSLLIGAGSTLLGQNLTAARALVSDVNGKVGTSTITAAELGYLAGLTKNAQSQFNELNENIADTNDNITQNDIMMYRLPTGLSRDNNADNFKKTGYYYTSNETINASEYGIITVVSVPAPWITQTWHRLDGKIYTREYSNISKKWSEWRELLSADQINYPSFRWGFIDDLNNFKQFSDSPKMMFGYGTGYNGSTKNAPINCAFCVLYIPYGSTNYGEQLLFSVQQVHGSYPIYKRTLENGSWSYWENISCPCNNYIYNGQQDWDGYLAVGLYSISFLTGHNSPSGPGVGQWGYLDVKPWGDYGANGCLQRYYSTAGKAVYRIKFDGNWSNWFALN